MAVQLPLAGSYSSALAKIAAAVRSSCHQHLAVGQQRRRVRYACGGEAAVAVQLPLAGSYSSALANSRCYYNPPATSTLPLGSNVAV